METAALNTLCGNGTAKLANAIRLLVVDENGANRALAISLNENPAIVVDYTTRLPSAAQAAEHGQNYATLLRLVDSVTPEVGAETRKIIKNSGEVLNYGGKALVFVTGNDGSEKTFNEDGATIKYQYRPSAGLISGPRSDVAKLIANEIESLVPSFPGRA